MIKLIILFHGYGANGDDLIPFAKALSVALPQCIILRPNAPFICDGKNSFKWFDINVVDREHFLIGLGMVYPIVSQFIRTQMLERGLSSSEILVGGFSQGASLAIYCGLHFEYCLGGVLSLSGGCADTHETVDKAQLQYPPVLLLHGKEDKILPAIFSMKSKITFDKLGIPSELCLFDGLGHGIGDDFIGKSIKFVQSINQK